MAVAARAAKAAPRTVTRDEPEPRIAEARAPERDPNKIYTRDGREVDVGRVQRQSDDRLDLASIGVFPPQGWTYEWRTRSVKGAPWTQAIADDEESGWTPVPASRHPGKIMPRGFEGPIEFNGLMLMERDVRLTMLAKAARDKAANEQLQISRSMQGLMQRAAPNSGAITDFDHGQAQRATGFRKVSEPENSGFITQRNYQYTLDE